ncbi:MAG: hypothetical protein HOP34_13855 [Methylococcaceae bacterium]|nr:hypothetical protein [Methylococcaceae bacterium]
MQYAQNLSAMNGELQDSALKEFIACFRRTAGKSFVLLSSRQALVELKKWQPEHYLSLDLQTLPHQEGAELLQSLGVTGKAAERQAISHDLNGHALSLVLFGHLLTEHHDGDPRYAKELDRFPLYESGTEGDFSNSDAEKDSRHALRVLDYYDSLQDAASRCFLQLLGLFDRPMNAAEKAFLIANAKHAEPLRALTDSVWKKLEQRLENCGLLLGKKGCVSRLEWDTHPIIRSYFGQKFKENYQEEFRQAHYVLFDFYQKLPEKEFPDTLDEMLPLYRAVVHGCLAEEYKKAREDVYLKRILREKEAYSTNTLNAYNQDLIALSAFFPQGWNQPVSMGLTEANQEWLLAEASFCLMSLGRLTDALDLRKTDLESAKKREQWSSATSSAINLSDLLLFLGKLNASKAVAEDAITFAFKSANKLNQRAAYVQFATVLHCLGELEIAKQNFVQAEHLEQEAYQQPCFLNSTLGARFCALLLDTANNQDFEEIYARGENGINIFILEEKKHSLSTALDYLTLARIYQIVQNIQEAKEKFDLAIAEIREAKKIEFTPLFYLYRADFYLTQNQLDPALADLNSAYEIIERCGMKLYLVDYLLIHGRYSLATADLATAVSHYDEAKELIEETGYHLRDAELDLFAAQICQYTHQDLHTQNADFYLQKAKNRIEDIGQWGLMPRWEHVAQANS